MTNPVSETEYRELANFLYHEAELLSDQDYPSWGKLLANDLQYRVPIPQFLEQVGARQVGLSSSYFDDDIHSMRIRLQLLSNPQTTTAEHIRSLLNHVVTNVQVAPGDAEDTYLCKSCITVHRTRFNKKIPVTISGRRTDLIRRSENGLQLVTREVKLTQSVVMSSNVSFFF